MTRKQSNLTPSKTLFKRSLLAMAMATVVSAPVIAAPQDDELARFSAKKLPASGQRQFSGFDITKLPGNRFAVVWGEYENGAEGLIKLQRFKKDGTADGAEVTVYTHPASDVGLPWRPVVAADAQGNMVVAWAISDGIGSHSCSSFFEQHLMARLVLTQSGPAPELIAIDVADTENACGIDASMDADGDFALLWHLVESGDTGGKRLQLRVMPYQKSGVPALLNPLKPIEDNGVAFLPGQLAMLDDGSFMVAWSQVISGGAENVDYAIRGQRYSAANRTLASNFRVDSQLESALSGQLKPNVAVDGNGGYMVTWVELDSHEYVDAGSYTEADTVRVKGQRWAADGTLGRSAELATYEVAVPTVATSTPSVSLDSEGNLLSAWIHDSDDFPSFTGMTVLSAENAVVGTQQDGFGELGQDRNFGSSDRYGARVAMNDQSMAILWSDNNPRVIEAVIYPGLVENDPVSPARSSSGGAIGVLGSLLALVLGGLRLRRLVDRNRR